MSSKLKLILLFVAFDVALLAGFVLWYLQPPAPLTQNQNPYSYNYGTVGEFKDQVETNTKVLAEDLELSFKDKDGKVVDLRSFRGKKNVLLVFMRGYPNMVCPNCMTQTSRLIKNYEQFQKRNTEILVVFPGPTEHFEDYLAASKAEANEDKVPFNMLFDEGFKIVDKLGIRGDLAKPSTYILDQKGQVRFAYVGSSTTDRPSLDAMLGQLDLLLKP